MSIICKPVKEAICQRVGFLGKKRFVRATIDPATKHQLNLPIDYQFHEVFLSQEYVERADRFRNFEIRSDDIWICGFPKSGTVWMQNIAKKLTQHSDFNIPLEHILDEFFEAEIVLDQADVNEKIEKFIERYAEQLERIHKMPSPRIIKSHLPPFLMPKEIFTKKARVIYIARNPKDSTVSRYHMWQNLYPSRSVSLEQTCELMINDEILFAPYPEHILSFWQLRNLDHVLFLTYEELSADRFAGCKKVSQFLGYNFDDGKLRELADLVEFNSMKERMSDPTQNTEKDPNFRHCRKGKVGGYRDDMSEEWIKRMDQWICDRFKNTDFNYSQWMNLE